MTPSSPPRSPGGRAHHHLLRHVARWAARLGLLFVAGVALGAVSVVGTAALPTRGEVAPRASAGSAVGPIAALNMPRTAPRVSILAPADGSHVRLGQPVILAGRADTPEDGALTGDALTWSSDRDGVLGTGETLDARSLSPGDHTITLTARASDGLQSTASITLHLDAWQSYLPLLMRAQTAPTPRPTNTPRPTRTPTPTATPTDTPTPTETPTPSVTPTLTDTPTPSLTPMPSLTPTAAPSATATPTAAPTLLITGAVQSCTGQRVAGATVTLEGTGYASVTDSAGRYSIGPALDFLAGDYVLTAVAAGYAARSASLTLPSSGTREVNFAGAYCLAALTVTPTATATLPPTSTPSATPTPTPTASATVTPATGPTPTETPILGVRVRGYVRVGSDTGPGLAGVNMRFYLGGEAPGPVVATTDANGFYISQFMTIPGQADVNLWAEKDGYTFYPPLISWRHYYGVEDVAYDFVASPSAPATPTPTITLTPTVTPTPPTLTVDRAWTADTANAERMAFKAGEGIRMCIQVTNRGTAPLTVPYSWTVVGENGSSVAALSGSDSPTFLVGQTTACRDGVVPAGVTWQQYRFSGTVGAAPTAAGSSALVFAGKLLVNETFTSAASGWPVADNPSYKVGYVSGEYQILIRQAGLSIGWSGPGTKTGDMVVELDGRRTDDVNDQYGIMLGLSDDRTQWVAFQVTRDGAFQVVQWAGLDQTQLYPMTASPVLRLGITPNHLMAMRQGNGVRVYANGQELARLTITGLPSPATQGLASQSWVANGDTRYDNFRMYSLTTAE